MPDANMIETQASPVLNRGPLEFRKLDINIRDNDYIAGKANITAVVIRNTYPNPVRIISLTARHSSLNSHTDDAVYTGTFNKEPQRKSRNKVNFRIHSLPFLSFFGSSSGKPLFEWQHFSSSERASYEPLYITAEDGSKLTLNNDVPVDREIYVTWIFYS